MGKWQRPKWAALPLEKKAPPHLTGEAKKNSVLVEKFLGGPKNNQLLNVTHSGEEIDKTLEAFDISIDT